MSAAAAAPAGPVRLDAFHAPKAGNAAEEYEDAWSVRELAADGRYRIAIADGATETSYSALWATLLVETYTRGHATGVEYFDQLEAARRLWRGRLRARPLPWYAAEKAALGAYAAFLGLELDVARRAWRAVAIGDCNLFHLDRARSGMRVVHSFPLAQSSDFGSTPMLIGSNPTNGASYASHVRLAEGALRSDDVLVFASDALAAWLLWRAEDTRPAWTWITAEVTDQRGFDDLVDQARGDGLRNDDVTLVRARFHG